MWDYQYTVGEIKKMLAEGDENQRLWLIAKIMRDARYSDVWKFISLQDFLNYRERLMRGRLGLQKDFWQFMYSRWIKLGIVFILKKHRFMMPTKLISTVRKFKNISSRFMSLTFHKRLQALLKIYCKIQAF
jgi:hypothetical protein